MVDVVDELAEVKCQCIFSHVSVFGKGMKQCVLNAHFETSVGFLVSCSVMMTFRHCRQSPPLGRIAYYMTIS